ncbi:MAG: hypothetical protein V4574_12590 [Pseudomonadota bacterium]
MKSASVGGVLLALATSASAQTTTPRPTLAVCRAAYQPPNATYTATITWNEPILYHGGQLVVGTSDAGGTITVQSLAGSKLDAKLVATVVIVEPKGVEKVPLKISDTAARYPLDAAVYSLSPTAYKNYKAACAAKACFFSATGDGVIRLTKTVRLQSAALTPVCPPQPILF